MDSTDKDLLAALPKNVDDCEVDKPSQNRNGKETVELEQQKVGEKDISVQQSHAMEVEDIPEDMVVDGGQPPDIKDSQGVQDMEVMNNTLDGITLASEVDTIGEDEEVRQFLHAFEENKGVDLMETEHVSKVPPDDPGDTLKSCSDTGKSKAASRKAAVASIKGLVLANQPDSPDKALSSTECAEGKDENPISPVPLDKSLERIFGAGATQLAEEISTRRDIQDESDMSDVPPIVTSTPDKGTDLSSKKRFRGEENRNLGVSGIVGSGSVSPSGDQASMDPKKQKLGEIGEEGTMVDDDGLQDTSSVNSEISSAISHELDQLRQQGKDPNATC